MSNARASLLISDFIAWKTNASGGSWVAATLDGFAYGEIADARRSMAMADDASCAGNMALANVDCLIDWIGKVSDRPGRADQVVGGYKPGVYQQLAAALQKMGRIDDGRKVLYESGYRRLETATWPNKIFPFISLLTGFGQKPHRLIVVFGCLFAIGYALSYRSNHLCPVEDKLKYVARRQAITRPQRGRLFIRFGYFSCLWQRYQRAACCNWYQRFIFVLDNGLPMGITLVEHHKDISHDEQHTLQAFFVFQKACGYLIFLLGFAALAQSLISK
jgi:hypothetical protein